MTTVNAIAAVAPAPAPAVAGPEAVTADGATFGAVLAQAMGTPQVAAGAAQAAPPTRAAPRGAAAGEIAPAGFGEVHETEPASQTADVPEADPTPSLAEVALPIEALTSFLAAFIALAVQAAPAAGAASPIQAGADDVTVAAVGLSIASSGQPGRAEELVGLAHLVGDEAAASDEGGLTALFAALLDEAGTEAAPESGGPLGQAVARPTADEETADAPTTGDDASLGALRLVELAGRAGVSEHGPAAVAMAALANVGDATAAELARLQPVAEVARLVATLTRELSAASGSVEAPEAPNGAPPAFGAATARALIALADAAQAVRAGQVSGSSQVTIQLRPESLGKVTLEVERTSGGAVARIVAATAEAQRAIAGNVEAVKEALAAIGVEVDRIEVSGPETGAAAAPAGFDVSLEAARPSAGDRGPVVPVSGRSETPVAASTATDRDEPVQRAEPPADWAAAATNAGAARSAPVEGAVPAPETTPARAGVAQLARDIADQAGVLLGQGKSQFQLQLRPEALGRLHMRMTLEGGEVTVQMRAESAAAKSAIESNLGQLKQSFQEQGIRINRFEVVVAQGQLAQEQGHPRRSRGWVEPGRPRSSGRSEDDFAGALAAATRPVDLRA